MTATYTFDVFSSLDGFGAATGNWTGNWGKQGPELLDHRLAVYKENQRMVFGANTYRAFAQMLATRTVDLRRARPMGHPDGQPAGRGGVNDPAGTSRLAGRDARPRRRSRHRRRLKEESDVPLRSHGSLSMNCALMAAGLVDRVHVTLLPVITGRTGADPIFNGAADFDLELIESRTLDGRTQELIYRPALHN
jgi:dihydrofolate reductase